MSRPRSPATPADAPAYRPGRTVADRVRALTVDTLEEATGRRRRHDAIRPRNGGPAGNATLTAWVGVLLLVLFLAELVTLLDVHGLISWHIALGALLIPPALLKTATTGWRIIRYYLGDPDYVTAGPPPILLRLLGPLVVLSTLAVLGSGVALVLIGDDSSRQTLATVLGQRVDALTLHQGSFIVWAVATGVHVLARGFPALRTVLSRGQSIPGRRRRAATIGLIAVLAALSALVVQRTSSGWNDNRLDHRPPDRVGRQH